MSNFIISEQYFAFAEVPKPLKDKENMSFPVLCTLPVFAGKAKTIRKNRRKRPPDTLSEDLSPLKGEKILTIAALCDRILKL